MSKLVRKIERSHWTEKIDGITAIGADAITQCLRTKGNAMSVFQISSEDQIDEVFLAVASNADYLETTDLVAMDQGHISELGLSLIQTGGITPIESLQKIHYDITELRYGTLGTIAYHVFECVRDNHYRRRTRGELKDIIRKAINDKRLDPSALKDGVKKDLRLTSGS